MNKISPYAYPGIARNDRAEVRHIIRVVSDYYGIPDIKAQTRIRPVVKARQIAMYLINERTKLGVVAIGREFGDRDHSTVCNACKRVDSDMTDPGYRMEVKEIRQLL